MTGCQLNLPAANQINEKKLNQKNRRAREKQTTELT